MKWNLVGAAAVVSMLPGLASAAPVYLDCVMTTGQEDVTWNVTLDEATSSVSYTIPQLNVAKKTPGIFSADKVLFNGIEISRIDLSMTRTVNLLGDIKRDKGQCKIPTTPARKF